MKSWFRNFAVAACALAFLSSPEPATADPVYAAVVRGNVNVYNGGVNFDTYRNDYVDSGLRHASAVPDWGNVIEDSIVTGTAEVVPAPEPGTFALILLAFAAGALRLQIHRTENVPLEGLIQMTKNNRTSGTAAVTPIRSAGLLSRLLLALVAMVGGLPAFAQSLAIAPSGYLTVSVGGTLQFNAVPTGFTISSIKWEVASVQGGSAATGTITTGLTAGSTWRQRMIPAQNPQTILAVATGTNGSKYSASVYVNIAPPPPVISSGVSESVALRHRHGNRHRYGSRGRLYLGRPVSYTTQQMSPNTL